MITLVLGTRAELIKMASVIRELARRKIKYSLVHTGQQDIRDLVKSLGLRQPDVILDNSSFKKGRFGTSTSSALLWNLKMFFKIRSTLSKQKPSIVLVHGDTMTTATSALAAKSILFNSPKVGHVEAGLRSFDLMEPFPEEISRRITDFFSNYLFAPTRLAATHVKRKKVFVTGNTNIDALKSILPIARESKLVLPKKPFVFANLHRQENIKSRERLENFVKIITLTPHKVLFVLAPNTKKKLEQIGLLDKVLSCKNLVIKETLAYPDFIHAYENCACMLTDGGGMTEESTYLKIPCIVYRKSSERQEAEECGTAFRSLDAQEVLSLIEKSIDDRKFIALVKKARCPYGEGSAGKKIVAVLQSIKVV